MTHCKSDFDSLMFDMDGTLWDAVDAYCVIWNRAFAACRIHTAPVDRHDLIALMGTPLEGIMQRLLPEGTDRRHFADVLEGLDREIMPVCGGVLYEGVRDTIAELSKRYRLFMVSNCGPEGLPMFLEYTGLTRFFTDQISYGATGVEKDVNVKRLAGRYKLEHTLYIGDTAGDGRCARKAGVSFAWASYGFGKDVDDYDFRIDSISDLLKFL